MHATDDTYQETLPSVQGRRHSGASINKLSPKLLLVDDEPAILGVVRDALHRVGVECITAESGQRGIELASDPTIDLLLLDLRLGDMDGIALLKELHRRGRHLPFAIITGYGTVQSAVELMKMGALDVIEKPFTSEEIAARTQLLLRATSVLKPPPNPSSTVSLDPGSAADRWALLVFKALAADCDPSTLEIWARVVGLSYSSLRQACCLAGVQATASRDFMRMLRAVRNCMETGQSMDGSLDVHDTRTLQKLLVRSGIGRKGAPPSMEEFIRGQRFIAVDSQALRALVKLLTIQELKTKESQRRWRT
jgi:DNA-binding response OmpR family regulator